MCGPSLLHLPPCEFWGSFSRSFSCSGCRILCILSHDLCWSSLPNTGDNLAPVRSQLDLTPLHLSSPQNILTFWGGLFTSHLAGMALRVSLSVSAISPSAQVAGFVCVFCFLGFSFCLISFLIGGAGMWSCSSSSPSSYAGLALKSDHSTEGSGSLKELQPEHPSTHFQLN